MNNIPIIIPAYKPNFQLIELIKQLQILSNNLIIVVADGLSQQEPYQAIFNTIVKTPNCIVLYHATNLGKGQALKTAFNYVLKHIPRTMGVVTADADGQHAPTDIIKTINTLNSNSNSLILGCRGFDNKVPLRSKIGNVTTKYIMWLLLRKKISDTQTGLRGIPLQFLQSCVKLTGNRYEFETSMLIAAVKHHIKITEVSIATIYIDNNKASGFNPFIDSMKIYFLLLRFAISGLISSAIDYVMFIVIYAITNHILYANYIARAVSLGFNFYTNKNFVFHSQGRVKLTLTKYLILCFVMVFVSYSFIKLFHNTLNVVEAKFLIEICLFPINMFIQKYFIFNTKRNK